MPTKTRINGQNYTQLPRLVSDDVILKGLPNTPGAPAGYGDLATAVAHGGQQSAKYSPTVMIDWTDEDVTPTLPPIINGNASMHSFEICPYNGKRGLHVVVPGGTGAAFRYTINLSALAGLGFFNQCYVMTYDNLKTFNQDLQVRAYSSANDFWGMQNILTLSAKDGGDATGGANIRTFNRTHRTAAGSPSTAESYVLNQIHLNLEPQTDGYDLWLFNVGFGQPRKSRVCIVYDDARVSSFTLGVPVFNSVGIRKQTTAMIAGRVGLYPDVASVGQLKAFVNSGGAVVAHSPHNPTMIAEFPNNPQGAMEVIKQNIQEIRDLGLAVPRFERCFIYAQGDYQMALFDTQYIEAMRAIGIDIARIDWTQISRAQRNLDAHSRLGRLACTNIGHQYAGSSSAETTNINNIITRIGECCDNGLDFFIMLHSVVAASGQEANANDISVPNLQLIANALKAQIDAGKLEAVTMPELVIDGDNYWNQF